MHPNFTFQDWFDHLRYLMPPQGLVHIGAGTGTLLERYMDWPVNTGVLVDAEKSYSNKLAQAVLGREGWSVHNAMVSNKEGETVFYKASNPNESGSLPPEDLTKLWQKLNTIEQHWVNATTLESLLTKVGLSPDCVNWLVIECLPALTILQGAGKYIEGWDVIVARVLLDENICPRSGASKIELDSFLCNQGYICISIEEERHPALANALYIKDWKAIQNNSLESQRRIQQLTQARDEQERLGAEWQEQIQQLLRMQNEYENLKQQHLELKRQLEDTLSIRLDNQAEHAQENELLLLQLHQVQEELEYYIVKANIEVSENTEFIKNLKDELAKLAAERDVQAALVAEGQMQILQLTQAQDELAAEREGHIQELTIAQDGQAKLVVECQAEIQQLLRMQNEYENLKQQHLELKLQIEETLSIQAEHAQENELFLLQLHQVQEEFECYIVKTNTEVSESTEYIKNLKDELAKLALERDVEAALAAEAQVQILRLTQVQDELAAERDGQIQQLAQARDGQAKLVAEGQAQIQQLAQARDGLAQQVAERDGQIQELAQARDGQAKLVAEGQAQIQQLAQARDGLVQQVAERDGQIQQLAQARDGQAKLVAEGQAQIQQLAQARDGLAQQVAERDGQIQQLAQVRDGLAQQVVERDEEIQRLKQVGDDQERLVVEMLEKIDSERNEKAKELIEQQRQTQHWLHHSNTLQQQLEERVQLIKQIEQQLAEQSYRQNLLDEEMIKAEAQIDLIKDILIREKAF